MFRFSLHGAPPRSVREDLVHGIVSRRTLYGIHRPIFRKDMDLNCSKTTLLFFTDRGAANLFAGRFMQKEPALRRPWRLESMPFEDLEKICLLNYLDMYLCFHVSPVPARPLGPSGEVAAGGTDGPGDPGGGGGGGAAGGLIPPMTALLDCYEYHSAEYPNRQILNMMMEDLWRRN